MAADDFLERPADEIGEAAVDGADFAIEAKGEEKVVKGIDEIAETLLGLGNHLEELLHLAVAGRPESFRSRPRRRPFSSAIS